MYAKRVSGQPYQFQDERLRTILQSEVDDYMARHTKSHAMHARASQAMPLGVMSSLHDFLPFPIYFNSGKGARMTDIDGNGYLDYHLAFGALAAGHSHPRLVAALQKQVAIGTIFGAAGDAQVPLSEHINQRFGLDMLRLCSSGTEATMDALRVARAQTGRDIVIKVEGTYHGHHDYVLWSVKPPLSPALGDAFRPTAVAASTGIPATIRDTIVIVPYNDEDAMAAALEEHKGRVAAVIMEPVMLNVGVVLPRHGYLEAVQKMCRDHGVLLIWDEVKTGATISYGGATKFFGITPDLLCLAKSISGGVPVGAFGGRREVMKKIGWDGVSHMGTFNGNPLTVRAALVTLTEILTPDAYVKFDDMQTKLLQGYDSIITKYKLPMYSAGIGAKGGCMFVAEEAMNYRDYAKFNKDLAYSHWLYFVNQGVFVGPGFDEQWTLCVAHTEADTKRHLQVMESWAKKVSQAQRTSKL